ncbi:bifunctional alpha,alpha-trehalose-phosphate synthase (UDP-forming)/trehalose-phosphatase [Bacteroides sp.]|uniref:bifunctional alpha,alpha-trehalose-phosphate synthase (UDP-forming)/trehalose-phosphatase n=1 Tax=Bacteroides sp. TaxID=29523 RepID=UPI00261FE3ED|nr:bifunctional alpha,alpha-trehalose-phosphate synthase (UDP-forming)/trehalose-phosphatase [Bacteroides sp.]MDD3039169.1 bifunctional alpha,alpha-trehalose-phosphate synthase (UDP-forming)/trehalose-phosphatase [Bacteroides sp.]
MKLYIIANRLPVKVANPDGNFVFTRSEGGLATGLDSLETPYEKHWIGWSGICTNDEKDRQEISIKLQEMNFHPVFLSDTNIKNYYEGYSNSTIWPLCHYFFAYTLYRNCFWQSYQEVNQLFCEEICRLVQPGDKVWIQDYQLMLLPGMLRKKHPDLCIGYFHHIPFPSYELFRILPERAEILKGLLGADFIAFHTHDYMRHFISAVERVLHIDFKLDEVQFNNRTIRVDALPMGINYELYHKASGNPEVKQAIDRTRKLFGNHKLILSVDRLDYSKGILHRLQGFATFLKHHPEYHGKVTLAMVIVPSRDHVGSYAELKTRIDEEIGAINGCYSTMNWTPVCYFYHSFSLEQLTAMYYVADIALVTPLRDGMNLVAKEYVATKHQNPGVLILSEMAGAATEMTDAIQINPNDTEQIENAICKALEMPIEEQKRRIQRMQNILSVQTINKWAADFVNEMNTTYTKNEWLRKKHITSNTIAQIKSKYNEAKQRLFLLDYDGTLAALKPHPEDAQPTPELIALLQQLSSDPTNHVVINSGRDHITLEKWLGSLPISMAAEHGAFYKENGGWHKNIEKTEWGTGILSILQMFVERTPQSRLEIKETALAWHYRESDAWLGSLRAQQLVSALVSICTRQKLQILQGNKVVEIKSPDYNKGSEVSRLLSDQHYDFILAMGDDTTDDDMFQAVPTNAFTIKIGTVSEAANYNLSAQTDVLFFLQAILSKQKMTVTDEKSKNLFVSAFSFFKDLLKNNPK